ncbi:MAG: adenine deaminase [Pseudomonadota bacterium]|nr:adenine deaminase [Pseudomonadota bacterium]MEE3099996.1 adenine deaminase [Pseudomonadota bacterium]
MTLKSWADAAPRLIDVAAGRAPADMVVRGGTWANVQSGEMIPGTDLAIADGRFAYCGPDAGPCIGPETVVIEAAGRVLSPGLIDAHMHVESGMLTVTEFVRAVAPHGSTTLFIDPHEIANVLGLKGVRLMHDEAMLQPTNVFVQAPSCVPSAPGLEMAGAEFGPDEIAEMMGWPNIVGLGEVMNFPGVVAGDARMVGEIAEAMRAGKTVGGHYASPDLGRAFHAYAAAGPADDHEGTRAEDALARVRQGMRAMLRLGSAWHDVAEQVRAVTEGGADPRNFVLCTDDCYAATLARDGHMDRVLRHAIAQGLRPITALQMATLNAATHFGMERELGSIAPGRRADFVITPSLAGFSAELVVSRGVVVAENGAMVAPRPGFVYPEAAKNTVRVGRRVMAEDFVITAPEGANSTRARVIGVVENQAPTRALEMEIPVRDGRLAPKDAEGDVCLIAVVERHRGEGRVVTALVSGFGYEGPCAVASTVAHDSHHLIVVGTSEADMAAAANRLQEIGGGVAVWKDGAEAALVPLPVAGLMSDAPAEVVAAQADAMAEAMKACGCTLNNAFMQHSLLALVVIPSLRISDQGLVDVSRFQHVQVTV